MSTPQAPIKIQYSPVDSFPGTLQNNLVGPHVPTAFWKLQNNFKDISPNKNDLQQVGTVPFVTLTSASTPPNINGLGFAAGPFNSSNYLFTSPNGMTPPFGSFGQLLNTLSGNAGFYLTFNFYMNSNLSQFIMGTQDNIFQVTTNGSGILSLTWSGTSLSTGGAVAANQWHSVVIFVNPVGLTMSMVLDGVSVGSQAISNVQSTLSLNIGRSFPNGSTVLNGYINDVNFSDGLRAGVGGFTNSNSLFVAKYGSDSNSGTVAAPYLTILAAHNALGGKTNVVILDDGIYSEIFVWLDSSKTFAASPGRQPLMSPNRGAVAGTYGARSSGIAQANTSGSNNLCVAKSGTAGGSGGHTTFAAASASPYDSITHAVAAAVAGDIITIIDSGAYTEDVSITFRLTIQALAGQLPTWTNADPSNFGIQVNVSAFSPAGVLTIFGINFQSQIGSAGKTISCPNPVLISDCTFQNCSSACILAPPNSSVASKILNCVFLNNINCINFSLSSFLTVTNNYFSSSSQTAGVCIFIDTTANAGFAISFCSFVNFQQSVSSVCISRQLANAVTYSGDSINFCFFNGFNTGISFGTAGVTSTSAPVMFNLYFTNGVNAIKFLDGFSSPIGSYPNPENISDILCYKNSGTDFSWAAAAGTTVTNYINNFCSIACGDPTQALLITCASSSNIQLILKNSTFLNAASNAVFLNKTSGFAITFDTEGVIEKGSGTNFITGNTGTNVNATLISTCYEKNITVVTLTVGAGSFQKDAKLLSTVAGAENVGLNAATSPCILSGLSLAAGAGSPDMGIGMPILIIAASPVTINGISFSDIINFHNAIKVLGGESSVTISYCGFSNLGPIAISSAGQCTISKNLFSQVNGNCVELGFSGCTVSNNVFANCFGAAILNSSFATIQNDSTYSCMYGLVELGVPSTVLNCIFSQSGIFDFSGFSTLTFSDVGTLDPSKTGTLDGTCIRTNPLYVNPAVGDLRLGSPALGSLLGVQLFFTSPAVGTGSGGQDMGAFSFTYGALVESWTLIDFATTGYRNPDMVQRAFQPIKYAEFTREDLSTESTQVGFVHYYRFTWEKNNDMPAAQLAALQALYTNPSKRVRIDFGDGNGFVEFSLLKNQELEWQELGGIGYSSKDIPTPIKELSFRGLS